MMSVVAWRMRSAVEMLIMVSTEVKTQRYLSDRYRLFRVPILCNIGSVP